MPDCRLVVQLIRLRMEPVYGTDDEYYIVRYGYRFRRRETICHLLYMDVIKLYVNSEKDISYRKDIAILYWKCEAIKLEHTGLHTWCSTGLLTMFQGLHLKSSILTLRVMIKRMSEHLHQAEDY